MKPSVSGSIHPASAARAGTVPVTALRSMPGANTKKRHRECRLKDGRKPIGGREKSELPPCGERVGSSVTGQWGDRSPGNIIFVQAQIESPQRRGLFRAGPSRLGSGCQPLKSISERNIATPLTSPLPTLKLADSENFASDNALMPRLGLFAGGQLGESRFACAVGENEHYFLPAIIPGLI